MSAGPNPNQKPILDGVVKPTAAAPQLSPEPISEPSLVSVPDPISPHGLGAKLKHLLGNKWVWVGVAVVILLAAGGGWVWATRPKPKPPVSVVPPKPTPPPPPPKPTTVADPLTGLQVAAAAAAEPVVGVMIENLDPDARPQSGLGQAGVVYEALAEGGITRFLALFQEPLPVSIGPVRSLRPYYLDWGLEYDAPVAHAGGSEPALANIGPLHLKNIDALAYDGSYFFRTTDRYAPHNLYTNADKLTALLTAKGFATAPDFTPPARKADAPLGSPTHTIITLDFSYTDYNVQYRYDAPSNSYARFMAGAAHIDRNTGKQIYVKNIVVEEIPVSYGTQADGKPETDYSLVGSGTALVFSDGGLTQGTWSKASDSAQTKLTDSAGQPIKLDVGNTWFEAVPTGNTVSY